MNAYWKLAVSTFGVMAMGGLLAWGGIYADVETLKDQRPVLEVRMQAVEQNVSALKAATDTRADADKEHRQIIMKQLSQLGQKIDRLLQARP